MPHPELRYHAATLQLLKADLGMSPERLNLIQQREAYCKRTFPASAAEWYALAGIEEFFTLHTEHCLVPLDRLGDPRVASQGYLRVATENQAVVEWYVPLLAGDDPPVLADNGLVQESKDAPPDLSRVEWVLSETSFSGFIFDLLADGHCGVYFSLAARDACPTEGQLRELEAELSPGPFSETEGRRT